MQGAAVEARERRRLSRQVRRLPKERDLVIGGDDKPAGQGP